MDTRPSMPAFGYLAPSKYLVSFLTNAEPGAFCLRLAQRTAYNFDDFNSMTWMLMRSNVYCCNRYTRAKNKATRDNMRDWCMRTMHYTPHAVFLTSVPLAGYPELFGSAKLAADIWCRASRHFEFKTATDADAFRTRFGALVEAEDKTDEDRHLRYLVRNMEPSTVIYL